MPIALGEGATRCRARQKTETPDSIVEDWRRYKASGSLKSRNRLVAFYMNAHVRPIAARIHSGLPRQVELDDLIQQGYLGLIDAMDRFELSRDIRFETFSRQRVSGAIHDYLRSIDPVPRLTRWRSKQLQAIGEDFRKEHGRPPSEADLRPILDLPEPKLRRFLADDHPAAVVPFSNVSPDGEPGDDGDAMHAFEDPRETGPAVTAQQSDLRRWLTRGFEQRDRLIIVLYYYEQMTMVEIGRTIGISESRVSQRLDSILACLRSRLVATGAEEEFIF